MLMAGVSAEEHSAKKAFEMRSLAWSLFSDTGRSGGERRLQEFGSGEFSGGFEGGTGNGRSLGHDISGGFGEFSDVGYVTEGAVFDSAGVENCSSEGLHYGSEGLHYGSGMVNAFVGSPRFEDVISALQKYLPSNNEDEDLLPTVDAYSCDEFRMYEFKVRRCMRGRSHDWTECPFAHPGEKARRRDPRRFHYSGTACPDFRKGNCRRGDACEFAHGVFECWLHPARYRTQPCKDGRNCKRRVCFFAHTQEQLRHLPSVSSPQQTNASGGCSSRSALALQVSALKNSLSASYDGSPRRQIEGSNPSSPRGYLANASFCSTLLSSPTSTLVGHSHSPPPLSPPLSPSISPPDSPNGWLNAAAGNTNRSSQSSLQKALMSPSAVRSSVGNQTLPYIKTSIPSSVPVHHRQLERMVSMPSIMLPSSPSSLRSAVFSDCSQPSSPNAPKARADLISSLQGLDLNSPAAASVLAWHGSPRVSNLRHCVNSKHSCDVNMADLFEEPVQRVESGRDLRAKIYGKLSKENSLQDTQPSTESPDLGWVSELVKE